MLVVAFVVVVPRVAASVGHPIILLALDAVTMLFWFAGFIALAVYITGPFYNVSGCNLSYCHGLRAIVVFGVFEWLLFCLTTVASLLLLVSGSKGTATTTTTTQGVAA
ncbi:MAG: hypothetical protein M1829_001593 [Trizodia sp. TS-e1964]|nr:MAG: hypothetical protein M1829_001593 [Trizodia sp. TS-e1964]